MRWSWDVTDCPLILYWAWMDETLWVRSRGKLHARGHRAYMHMDKLSINIHIATIYWTMWCLVLNKRAIGPNDLTTIIIVLTNMTPKVSSQIKWNHKENLSHISTFTRLFSSHTRSTGFYTTHMHRKGQNLEQVQTVKTH